MATKRVRDYKAEYKRDLETGKSGPVQTSMSASEHDVRMTRRALTVRVKTLTTSHRFARAVSQRQVI
jgi:CRISPR/Cas system type I-B associated protein Csh2 (Cas7 group RAMP superfamily)